MARRGRFGRSETGASNLSATIRQLVMEQQAAEEKALMDAFYNGSEINGAIPTMEDVRAFYAKWVDITGLTPDDADWQLVNQKIEGANNFDIKRTYQDLESTFKATNGSNYAEIVAFMDGRAKESTDQQDLNTYEQSLGVFANNYIVYRGDDLIGGQIKSDEYRKIVDDALSMFDPSDPMRTSLLVNSFSSQWTAMNRKKTNLLAIGKISQSGYASWARDFAKDILASGLNKGNTTYLDALAAAANVSGRGGGGAGSEKLNNTTAKLSALWTNIKSQFGGQESGFFPGQTQTTKDMLKEIALHPEWVQGYASLLDGNPDAVPQWMVEATGKSGSDAFIAYFGDLLTDGVDIAKKSGGTTAAMWAAAEQNAGTTTSWRVIKNIDDIWQKDRANANGDAQKIAYLDGEYHKFIRGEASAYGQLPDDPLREGSAVVLTSFQRTLVFNEDAALNGGFTGDQQNVSNSSEMNYSDKQDINERLQEITPAKGIAGRLQSGELNNQWNEAEGKWEAVPRTAATAGQGSYVYVSVQKMGEGDFHSQVRVVGTNSIKQQDTKGKISNSAYLWATIPDTGETIFMDAEGNRLQSDAFLPIGTDGFILADAGLKPTVVGPGQRVIYTDLTQNVAIVGGVDPSDPNSSLTNSEDMRIAAAAVEAVALAGIADPAVRLLVAGQEGVLDGQIYDTLIKSADDQALAELMSKPVDPNDIETRQKIADYSGDSQYAQFLQGQMTNKTYREVSPDVWQPITDKKFSTGFGDAQGQLISWFENQNPVLQTLSSPFAGVGSALLGVGGVLETLVPRLIGGATDPVIDARSQEQKKADNARGLINAASQVTSYQETGYGRSPGATFFRNAPAAAPTKMQSPIGSSYMNLQANVPTPVIPKKISPTQSNVRIVGAEGYGAVMTTLPKPIIINSGPRKGLPAGGGV